MEPIIFELDYEEMVIEKDAKIFEVGDYPDKEIRVSEADLDAIVENFAEVPVKVEHTDSPLDPLGTVKRIWRQGKELFARLAFPRDLASFLERRGIKRLSVALYQDPLRLAEVSLVLSPRVASAAMFGGDNAQLPTSNFQLPSGEEVIQSMTDSEKEIAELRFALRAKNVDTRLAILKAQGKIVPASEGLARELLLKGDGKIAFDGVELDVSQVFERFLEAQPKVLVFGELAPGSRLPETPLSAEEEELLAKLGLSREQYARHSGQ